MTNWYDRDYDREDWRSGGQDDNYGTFGRGYDYDRYDRKNPPQAAGF
jgi:hypothetical protein